MEHARTEHWGEEQIFSIYSLTLPSIFYIKMGKGLAEESAYGHAVKNDIIMHRSGRMSLDYGIP